MLLTRVISDQNTAEVSS